jgi:RNA polymerase sigma factor (sigma-70 family)
LHQARVDSPVRIDPEALLAESGYVRRLAHALVRGADADDVAQEVAVVALQQRAAPAHLRGWLAAVARRLSAKARLDAARRARHEAAAAPAPERDEGVRAAERLALQQRLTAAVLALPEPYRTAVTLRFLDELPPRAIAARLCVSSDVVRQRVARGIAMLRQRLDADFGERDRWVRALTVVGGVGGAGPWLVLPVLAMNKLVLGAGATAAVAAAAVWSLWPTLAPPPGPAPSMTAPAPTASAAAGASAGDVAAADLDAARREEVAVSPAQAPRCEVTVVDDRGEPVAAAVVHLWTAGAKRTVERETDAAGACVFEPLDGAGNLLVLAPGRFPRHCELADTCGRHRVELLSGKTVTGALRIDGQAAPGWDLRLNGTWQLPPLPESIADEVRFGACSPSRTRADGTFRFSGLPDGWRGSLQLPQALWLGAAHGEQAGAEALAVAAGDVVEVDAVQLPSLAGRVVWKHDGSPVARAQLTGYGIFDDEQRTPSFGYHADRSGAFVLGFATGSVSERLRWLDAAARPPLRHVRVTAHDRHRTTSTTIELDAEQLRERRELVLELVAPPVTHFRAVDRDGRPLAGARVMARSVSDPTDADGRGTFAGTAAEVTLVGAPQHRIGPLAPRAAAAGDAADPLVFELPETNRVEVVLRGREPRSLTGRLLRLRTETAPFAGRRQYGELDRVLLGQERDRSAKGRQQPDGSTLWYEFVSDETLDGSGNASLRSLEPGSPCTVALLDDLRQDLATATFVAPPLGEALEVVLHLPPVGAALRGVVVDEAGAPLLDAAVGASVAGTGLYRHTGADGAFAFGEVSTREIALEVTRAGFVQQRATVTPPTEPLRVVLQRGRVVEVRVVDEHGEPVDVRAYPNGTPSNEEALGPGRNRVRDLPPGVVTFFCKIGTHAFTLPHDTAQPVAILRVPRPGKVCFAAPAGWPQPPAGQQRTLHVVRVDGTGEPAKPWIPEADSKPRELLLPGDYRAQVLFGRRDGERYVTVPVGAPVEFRVQAGEDMVVDLR